MTSSLVGSEMCIRDSFSTIRVGGGYLQSNTVQQCRPSWTVSMGIVEASVSYTHLTLPTICSV
eukprot:8319775-Prorocentrum_lima.AAC.1